MHCCISTPTTDSNTSTGMIWVTRNMPSASNRQGIVREFHIVWRVVTLLEGPGQALALQAALTITFKRKKDNKINNGYDSKLIIICL